MYVICLTFYYELITDDLYVAIGGKKSKGEEIEHFIEKYKHSRNYNDVPVASMRHMIPIFLMEIYPRQYGQFSRKGKLQ